MPTGVIQMINYKLYGKVKLLFQNVVGFNLLSLTVVRVFDSLLVLFCIKYILKSIGCVCNSINLVFNCKCIFYTCIVVLHIVYTRCHC